MIGEAKRTSVTVQEQKISIDNLLFFVIEANSSFKIEHLMAYDGVIIDAQDESFTHHIIKSFRAHRNPEYYLKPIFLINAGEIKDPLIRDLHDGILFSLDLLPENTSKVRDIFLKTTHLDANIPELNEARILKKVFDYMYTRDLKSLSPVIDHRSSVGYTWPVISVNFQRHEESQVLELLEWADKEQLLNSEFKDRVYLCSNCSNGFMLYREVCPHCNSANVNASDIIHHFPCAYVGPIKDFQKEGEHVLVCPKCRKGLRHIGVDYDKPSIVNHCNSCDKSFQDVYVKAKCLGCHNDVEVQYLISHNISEYKIATKGASVATGAGLTFSGKNIVVPGTVPFDAFKMMVHYQLERVKNSPQIKSHLLSLHFKNIDSVKNIIGIKSYENLLKDMVELMRNHVQSSDFISVKDYDLIMVCLNDSEIAEAEQTATSIVEHLTTMVEDNLTGFSLECKTNLQLLAITLKTDELFKAALNPNY
ncbi:MAG: hypothetical protein IPJ79_15155 [Bacteroidetes bacterium]|nr:hypothetical protein [Bacteroidota bacterium]